VKSDACGNDPYRIHLVHAPHVVKNDQLAVVMVREFILKTDSLLNRLRFGLLKITGQQCTTLIH